MKIAQICPYDIHRPGGVQRHILDLSTALRELQHDVTIIAPRVPSRSTSACFDQSAIPPVIVNVGCSRVIRFNKTQLEISIALGTHHARLKRTVRDGEFDVLHFHTMLSPFLSAQIYKLSTSANVATFHDVPPATRFGFIQRRILRTVGNRLMRHLDGVIFASNVQSDIYRIDNLPLRVTIPPCTDLGRFPAAAVSNRINVDDCVNILFLGRLEPRKGVKVLLEAFRRLCSDGLPIRLILAGDGPERSALETFAHKHLRNNVIFLGSVADNDIPQIYAACDIFCAPSLFGEGFGVVLTEAMAAGKPIVAAANEGYRTLMCGEANEFLVTPGDIDATATKLKRLVLDPALRRSLGKWGQQEYRKYDSRTLVPQFVALYEESIRKRTGRRRI